MKLLGDLLEAVPNAPSLGDATADLPIHRISDDSREEGPAGLFIAIQGTKHDSHDKVPEAVANGAVAVIAEREVAGAGVPVVRVANARRALAALAAAWHDHPARKLDLVGITGTLGKTSVLMMLEAILKADDQQVVTIGSLGVHLRDSQENTGHTVPGPLVIHDALARAVEEGTRIVAMEVTSHALAQDRVHGLRFGLGVFTNLVPLEHMEYHGSFEDYVAAKSRFFDHLFPGAPVVYSGGDPMLQTLVREHGAVGIPCGRGPDTTVQVGGMEVEPDRTRFTLRVNRPLPCRSRGGIVQAEIPLELRLLGRSNTNNAALAAAAALCLGVGPDAIRAGLVAMEAPPRRMKLEQHDGVLVLDDTVGHPDSITAVFEVAEQLPHRRLHVVFAIRGQRGIDINSGDAEALSVWAERVGVETLIVTRSTDVADERNTVGNQEREAFLTRLEENGCVYRESDRLEDAVEEVLAVAGEGDLVLLLGAQGMDAGGELIRRRLEMT